MLTRPFLTELDTRAEVKGSIDPLGAMAIWSRLGHRVVGNLSTVTTSVKDFKTLVLGFGLLRDLRRDAGADGDVDEIAAFLRWEQLAAYTRASAGDWRFRGLRRVRRRLGEGHVVPISSDRDSQILGNQKTYGLWGLFTVPARASGLLQKEANDLTQTAADFVDQTWKRSLAPTWDSLLKTIAEDTRRFNLERRQAMIKSLRPIWAKHTDSERPFWINHVVRGGPADRTAGRQVVLAKLLLKTLQDKNFSLSQRTVRKLARQAAAEDPQLEQCLLDIAASESVLAYADALFAYLQTLDGQPFGRAVDAVNRAWPKELAAVDREGFASLQPHLAAATGNPHLSAAWIALSNDLGGGRWADAISRLLLINRLVMQSRGGAAWIAEERGLLRVRFRDEAASLLAGRDLHDLWKFPYFLESLRSVVSELGTA